MPVELRFVCRFAAEPPQEHLPYGRWGETLKRHFLGACDAIVPGDDDTEEDIGSPGDLSFFPDRTWNGRTYVPVTTETSTGMEIYGYISYVPGDGEGNDARDFYAIADYTDETSDANPEWRLDLCDEVIGTWRGEEGKVAEMTLVWGRPVSGLKGGAIVTAELADLTVDQCELTKERFTVIAPDNYRHDTLEIKLFDERGSLLASESLLAGDEDDDETEDEDADAEKG